MTFRQWLWGDVKSIEFIGESGVHEMSWAGWDGPHFGTWTERIFVFRWTGWLGQIRDTFLGLYNVKLVDAVIEIGGVPFIATGRDARDATHKLAIRVAEYHQRYGLNV